jgi:predicted lipoprotein with Yx(FWY)xxD motif
MHRSWITARCCPVLVVVVAAACASRGSTTNVSSPGEVARDTAASTMRVDTAARVDTAMRADTTTRRDTAVAMPAAPAAAAGVELSVADAPGVGAYVTDASGRAVYIIESSDNAAVECVGPCATEFDPVIGTATIATGATGLEASMLGTRALPDGRQQVTYNGKPLYFSRSDAAKGDTKGQGTKSYGNARLLTPKK